MQKRRMCMITVRRPTRTTKRRSERIWHPAGDIVNDIARCLFSILVSAHEFPETLFREQSIENLLSLRYFVI